jgi:uncharacterized protein YukJ
MGTQRGSRDRADREPGGRNAFWRHIPGRLRTQQRTLSTSASGGCMKNYGVLKGSARKFKRDEDDDPHSELLVEANGTKYRIAINVRSSRGPVAQRLVEYAVIDDLRHPVVDSARALPIGWNDLRDQQDDGAAIDYIRSNLFRASDLKPLAHTTPGPDNDLFERIEALLERAIGDQKAQVYAFGEKWGPEQKADPYFGFEPGNGVHDIHMNQGDPGEPNATFQDGALLFDFPGAGTTTGLFIKFQNQEWHTDEQDGDPLPGTPTVPPLPDDGPLAPWDPVPGDSPYRQARIVGALVNPGGDDPGKESVTIFNTSLAAIMVDDWRILDRRDQADVLRGTIPHGEARTFVLTGRGAQLSNEGGTISLLDARGLKVDGVAYTKAQAKRQGTALTF